MSNSDPIQEIKQAEAEAQAAIEKTKSSIFEQLRQIQASGDEALGKATESVNREMTDLEAEALEQVKREKATIDSQFAAELKSVEDKARRNEKVAVGLVIKRTLP